jgi:hypothetical protein
VSGLAHSSSLANVSLGFCFAIIVSQGGANDGRCEGVVLVRLQVVSVFFLVYRAGRSVGWGLFAGVVGA